MIGVLITVAALGLLARLGFRLSRAVERGTFTGLATFLALTVVSDLVYGVHYARSKALRRKNWDQGLQELS